MTGFIGRLKSACKGAWEFFCEQLSVFRLPASERPSKRSSIRYRILTFVVSFTLILWLVLSFVGYSIIISYNQRSATQNCEDRLSYISASAEARLSQVESFFMLAQSSRPITDYVETTRSGPELNENRLEAFSYLQDFYNYNSTLFSYSERMIASSYSTDTIVQVVTTIYSITGVTAEGVTSAPYFDKYIGSEDFCFDEGFVDNPFPQSRLRKVLPLIRPIYHHSRNEQTGFIYVALSPQFITDILDEFNDSETFYISLGQKCYAYVGGELLPVELSFTKNSRLAEHIISRDTAVYDIVCGDGKRSTVISRAIGESGWSIMQETRAGGIWENIGIYILMFVVFLLVATLIGFAVAKYLYNTVTVPVAKLGSRVTEIAKGDFTRDPEIEWENELGDIGKSINYLSENVRVLIDQKVEDEKQKRLYEYRMLQSQINPHFMYNTLNTIKWMAVTQGADGIGEMTTALARLLRQISNGTRHLVRLSEEILLLSDFFTIQQYRYGGAITLDYNIEDKSLVNANIIRFTLQPLVENAIFHGIEPKGAAGEIKVNIFRAGEDVQIDVIDNGVGMSPETIRRILTTEEQGGSSAFFKELGVSSVSKRLQYEFGEGYGISAESVPGEYTKMTVLIPYNTDDPETARSDGGDS